MANITVNPTRMELTRLKGKRRRPSGATSCSRTNGMS